MENGVDVVQQLIRLMNDNALSELELENGGLRIRLKRGVSPSVEGTAAAPLPPATLTAASSTAPAAAPHDANPDSQLTKISSPMVGTFYRARAPGAEPFVNVGDHVDSETVVCLIEAMKVMNEIKAETSGEIVKALARDGDAVEFGQPMFLVKPA